MIDRLKQHVSAFSHAKHWYVAFSGGKDSHTLLHALHHICQQDKHLPELIAVHVNHQLQPDADAWQAHCESICQALGIPIVSHKVDISSSANLEENARKARYDFFQNLLKSGDVLFAAHHQSDQVETFFYRLFRGSGITGLSSMQFERSLGEATLARPFLDTPLEEIQQYATENQLDYIDDPSNTDESLDRNFIRHSLLPLVLTRWQQALTSIQRATRHMHEADLLLKDLAQIDLDACDYADHDEPFLDYRPLLDLPARRLSNAVRYWLISHGLFISEQQLKYIIDEVIGAQEQSVPELRLGDKVLRRYQKQLFITRPPRQLFSRPINWHALKPCHIPGYGEIELSEPVNIRLKVAQRKGGEMIKPLGSQHTRRLKNLYQELNIPPWRRDCLPLVYYGDELIAVADFIYTKKAEQVLGGKRILRKP